jgi:phospholipase/lecithinase/hemolysin
MAKLPGGATYFDTAGLLRNIVANPATYGFTNVTDACYGAAAKTVCANPNQYLFFDDLHPSAQGHVVLAEAFAAAVPEPSTWMLLGCTLICAAPAARRLLK